MFTETEAKYCFSKIFRGGYQELQNNRLKHKNTGAIIFFAYTYAAVVLMITVTCTSND